MTNPGADTETPASHWAGLYRAGGLAALAAGLLFRRNIAAEVGLFAAEEAPVAVSDWFALLHGNRLLGLVYLNVLDVVNYALLALTFLALYAALRRAKSLMAIATPLALLGIGVYLASNTAFSMLSLAEQYAGATAEAERTQLLAAGQALLALNRFSSPGGHPGAAGYASQFLVATAGLMASVAMLRSGLFHRVTAYVGIAAAALDLAYCLVYAFVPAVDSEILAVALIPAAGLLLMVWHILLGQRLVRLGRAAVPLPAQS